jgi:phosphoglycolate phosphatase-like HAD superfamily hydrolase
VQVALKRAGVDVARAVFVGDTATIAVLSGGVSRGELETASAQAVFDNPGDLCEHLDSTAIGTLAKAVPTA